MHASWSDNDDGGIQNLGGKILFESFDAIRKFVLEQMPLFSSRPAMLGVVAAACLVVSK